MTNSTYFIDQTTPIVSKWLNDVNTKTFADPQIAAISAPTGSSLVGFQQSGTGAAAQTLFTKVSQTVSVTDFYANGVSGALVDPTGVIDSTLGIQAAINSVTASAYQRGAVFFPAGYYIITASLKIPNYITMYGVADNGTVINNQTVTLAAPQCVNASATDFTAVTIKDMVFTGGQSAFLITSPIMQYCNFINVTMQLQTQFNINCINLEVNNFTNCTFADAPYAVYSASGSQNMNNFKNCSFNNHLWSDVYFHGSSSVNNFDGCRFEAGGGVAYTTVDVVNPSALNFNGCYFENTSGVLLNETGSTNSTVFEGCHFTQANGGAPYTFNSDGIVVFGTNDWYLPSVGPSKVYSKGVNSDKFGSTAVNKTYFSHTRQHKHIVSNWIPCPGTLQKDLVVITKLNSSGATSNLQILTGVLTVQWYTVEAGGFDISYSRRYHVKIANIGAAVPVATLSLISSADFPRSSTLTVQQKAGATATSVTIEAVATGMVPGTELGSLVQYSFEYIGGAVVENDYMTAALA